MKKTMIVIGIVFGTLLFGIVAFFFSPAIDNRLGFVTGRALRTVQNHRENGVAIADLVNARFPRHRWSSRHRDYLSETYVRCDAESADGSRVGMVWIVTSEFESPFRITMVATAHSAAALEIAPSLYVPGHRVYPSPYIANR
jgi:hypothetical protein